MTTRPKDQPAETKAPGRTRILREFGLDRYGLLMVMLVADLFLLMVAPLGRWQTFATVPFVAVTLLLALRTSQARHRTLLWARVIALLAIVLALIQLLSDSDRFVGLTYLLLGLLLFVTPFVVIRRVAQRTRVDASMVMGALCVYVLIGLIFAFFYAGIEGLANEPFFAETDSGGISDCVYMSFITLTTTGYGDVTPAIPVGRALAVFEALLGQIYLVTTVARMVSLFGTDAIPGWRRYNHDDPDGKA